jgi:hypothetical protein
MSKEKCVFVFVQMYRAQTARQARKEKKHKLVTKREGPTDPCEMEVLPLKPPLPTSIS